jgi:hypothetical protein
MSAVETPATDLTEVIGRKTGTGQKKKQVKSETSDPCRGKPGKEAKKTSRRNKHESIQKSEEWRTFLDEF